MHRQALLVGIEFYEQDTLPGCEEDAQRMRDLLSTHADGEPNYTTRTLDSSKGDVTRDELRDVLNDLFANSAGEDLLFYFAGHGVLSPWGADLVTYEYAHPSTGGVSMQEVMTLAHNSDAREIVIILDCCFSGNFADVAEAQPWQGVAHHARLRHDMSILAASRPKESAEGSPDGGEFTNALVRGLEGAAADPIGEVTPMGLHMFASQSFLTNRHQQPVFKGYHTHPPVLRKTTPRPGREILNQMPGLFPAEDAAIEITDAHLAVSGEGEAQGQEEKDFANYLQLQASGFIEIDGRIDLTGAAGEGAIVRLSPIGRYYWWLVTNELFPWLQD